MTPEMTAEVQRIAADRVSGATALVERAVRLLLTAALERDTLFALGAALTAAQPAMAGMLTAAALAQDARDPGTALQRLAERIRRAPHAISRFARPLLDGPGRPLRIVTCSRSQLVEHALRDLGAERSLRVSCAESQPGGEGVLLAEALRPVAQEVEVYGDASIGLALPGADALVVGADAISSSAFVNKVGTAPLAALARVYGVTVLVLAGREKIVPPGVFERLTFDASPQLFERTPMELTDMVVTEAGASEPREILSACLWANI